MPADSSRQHHQASNVHNQDYNGVPIAYRCFEQNIFKIDQLYYYSLIILWLPWAARVQAVVRENELITESVYFVLPTSYRYGKQKTINKNKPSGRVAVDRDLPDDRHGNGGHVNRDERHRFGDPPPRPSEPRAALAAAPRFRQARACPLCRHHDNRRRPPTPLVRTRFQLFSVAHRLYLLCTACRIIWRIIIRR